ncbi:NmrA/HSCARG family protein [Lusitaniella coriacea]|uniref:NmrA/HSCARG family protein n=1 Tax=Lusitaniella coriacea TaxID=1983105 RepID=UPI003CF194D4
MSKNTRTILVFGATGAMGSYVIQHLLRDQKNNWKIQAFTRNPDSSHAQSLVELDSDRIELLQGDLNDYDSIAVAMKDVYGVFCNTNFWTGGSVTKEREIGLAILDAARKANIQHFVYSSLDACAHISQGKVPVPHFDAKAAVEHEIDWRRSDEFMRQESGWYSSCVSVLKTLAYFENLFAFMKPKEGTLSDGREGFIFSVPAANAPYPFIALDDIGWFATHMFAHRDIWGGLTLEIGGERLTFAQLAATFERVTGIPAEYQPMSDEEFLALDMPNVHDPLSQFKFHREYGPYRDRETLKKIHPDLMNFETWLQHTNWRGESREVQKNAITGGT